MILSQGDKVQSNRIFLSCYMEVTVWSQDLQEAYFESLKNSTRKLIIKLPKELDVFEDGDLEL